METRLATSGGAPFSEGDINARLEATDVAGLTEHNAANYEAESRRTKRKRTAEDDNQPYDCSPEPADIQIDDAKKAVNPVNEQEVVGSVQVLIEDPNKKSMLVACAEQIALQTRQNDIRRQFVDSRMLQEEELLGSLE